MLAGGCRCGAVRYSLGEVRDAGLCHCPVCRRTTGSTYAAWAEVAPASLTIERGTPRTFEDHAFCGACGSALWQTGEGFRRVHVGTLDDPSAAPPRIHLAAHQQVPWLRVLDLVPWTETLTPTPPEARKIWIGPADPAVTRASALSLREIVKDNLRSVLFLDVNAHQYRFVASNAISLAQLAHAPAGWARAIYAGEVAVGFVMMDVLDEDVQGLPTTGEPYVWRFMIDHRYQRLGFGRQALDLIGAEARARTPAARELWLSAVPSLIGPIDFYKKIGFVDTGVVDDGELFMRRPY